MTYMLVQKMVCLRHGTCVSFVGQQILTCPLFCFRSRRVDRGLFFVHEEYLVAVDLASDFLGI